MGLSSLNRGQLQSLAAPALSHSPVPSPSPPAVGCPATCPRASQKHPRVQLPIAWARKPPPSPRGCPCSAPAATPDPCTLVHTPPGSPYTHNCSRVGDNMSSTGTGAAAARSPGPGARGPLGKRAWGRGQPGWFPCAAEDLHLENERLRGGWLPLAPRVPFAEALRAYPGSRRMAGIPCEQPGAAPGQAPLTPRTAA